MNPRLQSAETFVIILKLLLSDCSVVGKGPVAQLDRVFDYESKGRGFESRQAHQKILAKQQFARIFLFKS